MHSKRIRSSDIDKLMCNYCSQRYTYCGSTSNMRKYIRDEHRQLLESEPENVKIRSLWT
jgi:hypothetical protein